ncbi:ribonuclease PH, partial [Oxalobacteraceae bacterium OM1]
SKLVAKSAVPAIPVKHFVAAVSVGVYRGVPVLDLDYLEDSDCDTDMNVVMTEAGHFVEVQGTAEGEAFDRATMNRLLDLAQNGIAELIALQKTTLGL